MTTSNSTNIQDKSSLILEASDELSHTAAMVAFLQSTFVNSSSPEDLLHDKARTGLFNVFGDIEKRIENVASMLEKLRT